MPESQLQPSPINQEIFVCVEDFTRNNEGFFSMHLTRMMPQGESRIVHIFKLSGLDITGIERHVYFNESTGLLTNGLVFGFRQRMSVIQLDSEDLGRINGLWEKLRLVCPGKTVESRILKVPAAGFRKREMDNNFLAATFIIR